MYSMTKEYEFKLAVKNLVDAAVRDELMEYLTPPSESENRFIYRPYELRHR